ncbi:MAG: ACT domain-containing protein [Eubacterium sp.]
MPYMERHSVDGLNIDSKNLMISLKRVPISSFIFNRCLNDLAAATVNDAIDVSFIVLERDLETVKTIIDALGDEYPEIKITINKDITRLSVSGIGMRTQSGVAANFFQVLADNDIQILMIATSEIRISCIIKASDTDKAVEATKIAFKL